MFKVGDCVAYKKDVCKIDTIKENHINNVDYYVLVPVYDGLLKTLVPVDNKNVIIRNRYK